jgi:putative ABC transport system ATP-binding protein
MIMSYVLECKNIHKSYYMGDRLVSVLKGISFAIEKGSFVAIMGPSGSGKSTLMNIIGCLDKPDAGELLLNNINISDKSAIELAKIRNQSVGFVFQQFNLLSRTTALNNVCLPLLYSAGDRKKYAYKAEQALAKVGLADRIQHHPAQLSGGQQQRVAIARSIINQPAILLADEPTGALDTKTGLEIMALFQELNNQGMTIIMVTHEPEIAAFANRVLLFRDGLLQSDKINKKPSVAATLLNTYSSEHFIGEEYELD